MDNGELISRATAVCEHCVDILEEKLDAMDIALNSGEIDDIIEHIMFVIEDNVVGEM